MRSLPLLVLLVVAFALLTLPACGSGGGSPASAPVVEPEPESIKLFRSWVSAGGAMPRLFDKMRIYWGHYDGQLDDSPYRIFDELGAWGEADVMQWRTLHRDDTPDFALFEEMITNGRDDVMRVWLHLNEDGPWGLRFDDEESDRFIEVEPGVLAPDAVGCRITRVEVRLKNASFVSPGQDRNGNGIWTDYSALWELDFYGYRLEEPAQN